MDGYSSNFHTLAQKMDTPRECVGEASEHAWDMFRRLMKSNNCGNNGTRFDVVWF
jgi:hypothetical protein